MATELVSARLRTRIREERERRGWSRAQVAATLGWPNKYTVDRIESGKRPAYAAELAQLADLYGMSTDALLGRRGGNTDLAWSVSRLSGNAQKMANDASGMATAITNEWNEIAHYARGNPAAAAIKRSATSAIAALNMAAVELRRLSNEFPAGGIGTK